MNNEKLFKVVVWVAAVCFALSVAALAVTVAKAGDKKQINLTVPGQCTQQSSPDSLQPDSTIHIKDNTLSV